MQIDDCLRRFFRIIMMSMGSLTRSSNSAHDTDYPSVRISLFYTFFWPSADDLDVSMVLVSDEDCIYEGFLFVEFFDLVNVLWANSVFEVAFSNLTDLSIAVSIMRFIVGSSSVKVCSSISLLPFIKALSIPLVVLVEILRFLFVLSTGGCIG